MDDYMAKPINFDELAAVVRRLLRGGQGDAGRAAPAPSGPDAAILDPRAAMERLGIDEGAYAPILAVSLKEIERRMGLCRQALDTGNMVDLALHAHTLKSTTSTIGAMQSAVTARRLEHAADAGRRDEAHVAFGILEKELCEVSRRIRTAQSGIPTPNPAPPAV
jgi:HPt (histidine-containing phosphotransfer) domain-containing protein